MTQPSGIPFIYFARDMGPNNKALVAAGLGELKYAYQQVRQELEDVIGAHDMVTNCRRDMQIESVDAACGLVAARVTGASMDVANARQINSVSRYAVGVFNLLILLEPLRNSIFRLNQALTKSQQSIDSGEIKVAQDIAVARANCVAARHLLRLADWNLQCCRRLIPQTEQDVAMQVINDLYADTTPRGSFGEGLCRSIPGYARRSSRVEQS
jgi:hypothetical protein